MKKHRVKSLFMFILIFFITACSNTGALPSNTQIEEEQNNMGNSDKTVQ